MEIRKPQNKNSTKALAMRWHDEQHTTQQKILVRKMGLRWSELNQFPYWDPVRCVVLGILHNWYEGVLQHHFRFRWGINGLQENLLKGLTDTEATNASKETESDKTVISTRGILRNVKKTNLINNGGCGSKWTSSNAKRIRYKSEWEAEGK
ncbi:hypothetical protein O181_001066 [Austropuccinia psidii MF-1]|uniref:Uncharacterized protein n=1 Tax=Austropuccinia psidii MF-1 TaxID=1389203 RepID=A0A9Q3GC30_9BASI|nr:hypothetical protein [Austropuccinia psidii MF-1]